MRKYSIIIPVYNRPDEINELLASLTRQTYTYFEVLVVEDGSAQRCEEIVKGYRNSLDIQYFYKKNSGQGFTRNFGFERATGDYYVVFDSDCIIPPHYFETVDQHLNTQYLDAYGGPDRAHPDFTSVQKAISYSMTSIFTTGGIRGNKKHVGTFHPRSFNMGISKEVFRETNGYIITRMGEDIEFSIRIIRNGFRTGLIEDAYVFHKRRTNFRQFYNQLHFFGRARINIQRFFPKELKPVHTLPGLFTLFCFSLPIIALIDLGLFGLGVSLLVLYLLLVLIDATIKNKSLKVGFLSVIAVCVQLTGYGMGFLSEGWKRSLEK